RGQALHQDNFYLAVKPFSCIAAWTAIDPAIPENGGLYVVPDTHNYPVVCPKEADPNESFFQHFVPPPEGKKAIPARLEPGDTLFFNGNVIHGSGPNRHETLWRRSYICHYLPSKAAYLAGMYNPCLRFDGTSLEVAANPDGGPCGKEWEGKLPYVA
ncbi:MAG: phytanoyl-CoA dioxygenase family protein, partial [Verrucomicrobiae bacterium]|nr:phytanoyl-CoA dioxygenase family protein [Verrucomicrobiae bacterium]